MLSVLFVFNFSLSQSLEDDSDPLLILGSLNGRSEEIVERVLKNVLTSEESRTQLRAFIANEVDEEEEYMTCFECRVRALLVLPVDLECGGVTLPIAISMSKSGQTDICLPMLCYYVPLGKFHPHSCCQVATPQLPSLLATCFKPVNKCLGNTAGPIWLKFISMMLFRMARNGLDLHQWQQVLVVYKFQKKKHYGTSLFEIHSQNVVWDGGHGLNRF